MRIVVFETEVHFWNGGRLEGSGSSRRRSNNIDILHSVRSLRSDGSSLVGFDELVEMQLIVRDGIAMSEVTYLAERCLE